MTADDLRKRMRSLGNVEKAAASTRFFKTGPGETGEGLRFLGLDAANLRSLAKEFRSLPLLEVESLLHGEWHDERAAALLILVQQFPNAPDSIGKSAEISDAHWK